MTKFIFLDTNVFLHCKSFTEIEWRELFKNSKPEEDIVIVVPYMVNKELDNIKKSKKKARNLQSKLKNLKDVEFKEGITLNITIFPVKWNSLRSEWAEKLDEKESDCKIIAEILLFQECNPNEKIFFITGDNTPYFQAEALNINTIFWLDEKYKNFFKPSTSQTQKINKLTDLQIFFKNRENSYQLNPRNDINLEEFIENEFPDYPNLLEDEIDILNKEENLLNDLEIRDDSKKIDLEMTLGEAEEKGLTLGDITKNLGLPRLENIFTPLSLLNLKTHEQFKEEVLKYYEDFKSYQEYFELCLYLENKGNKPYNNVKIEIFTILEKGFDLKAKEELEKPKKPEREMDIMSVSSFYHPQNKEYNIKYISPSKLEKEKKDRWIFGYKIRKIQHNDTLSLYPIMIKFPESYKTKVIQLICRFKHDEEGITKEQKLSLDVSNVINNI